MDDVKDDDHPKPHLPLDINPNCINFPACWA
jgi:hypothetical protein